MYYRWCTTGWHSTEDYPHLPTWPDGRLLPPSGGRDHL